MNLISIAEVDSSLTAPGKRFEMTVVDIRGTPTRTWKHAPPHLRAVLERSRRRGEAVFLVYEDERISFEEHFVQAATLAHRLRDDLGVRKGDRVAIAMRNSPEWSVAFFASVAIGAILVPLNAWWTGAELAYGLEDSGASVVFVDDQRLERLRDQLPRLGLEDTTVLVRADGRSSFNGLSWADLLEVEADGLPDIDLEPDDDATIFYTSGTTGVPKGALGTHRNLATNLLSLSFSSARTACAVKGVDADEQETRRQSAYLLSVPLYHATGCHSILVPNLASGGKLVMMHKWSPERALELIERERITTFGGVPTMVWQVLESPDLATRDISSVRIIGYGGAPAPPELVHRIETLFPGRTPSNGYGLTETSSVTTINAGPFYLAKPDSVGVPVPVVDLRIADRDGDAQPVGQVGELLVRGPNVVRGYWGKPDETASAFVDGWLRTGDLARVDEEGFLYIVDRVKDMIIRGGENVYCAEVEAVLYEHPAVLEAAVFGVPHHQLGEEVAALVRLRSAGILNADEVRSHVRERLALFKVPAHVWFTEDELPRNAAGKVLKKDLRDRFRESPV